MTRRTAQVEAGRLIRDPNYVACRSHGAIHAATTDPFDYGEPDCALEDHRPVYWRPHPDDEEYGS